MNGRSLTGEGLAESSNDDDHELNTVWNGWSVSKTRTQRGIKKLTHPLTTNNISQPTEQELTNEGADGSGDFNAKILIGREFTT